jgi:hypothetical protein
MSNMLRESKMVIVSRSALQTLSLAALAAASAGIATADTFTEAAEASGLDFVQFNGMTGEFYMIENLGGGVALFDYDNDGDLDVYLVQGAMLDPGKTPAQTIFPPPAGVPLTDRLYRNDLKINADGTRSLHFTDVTGVSGIRASGYGMGVTAGDIDNDGRMDLYVSHYVDNNVLLHNNGDGTFTDITDKAGLTAPGAGAGAAFVDYDRDGFLDLYVGNYVDFSIKNNKKCFAPNGARDYCSPTVYSPLPDRLYHNRGDGTFEDVSASAGIRQQYGPALGISIADFNADGWPDIYVANDAQPNLLWINQKDGTFKDEALLAGVAVNMQGASEASMGVDTGDFDGDGDEDLFMTHFTGETNTIYVNDGNGWFEDRSLATGLAAPSKPYTSFGTAWIDYDNDGWLDLLVANGGVNVIPILVRAGDTYPLHQPNQLFANRGDGTFSEVTAGAGRVFELSEVSRGLAIGDLDNDGDTDAVVVNNSGPARLLINNAGNRNHWLGLRIVGANGGDALGARVSLERRDGAPLWRRVRTDGSYASAQDPRVLFGLGKSTHTGKIRVYWPDGSVEEWSGISPDRYTTLRAGEGKPVES